jgi:hypothetical protein
MGLSRCSLRIAGGAARRRPYPGCQFVICGFQVGCIQRRKALATSEVAVGEVQTLPAAQMRFLIIARSGESRPPARSRTGDC